VSVCLSVCQSVSQSVSLPNLVTGGSEVQLMWIVGTRITRTSIRIHSTLQA